MEGRVLRDRYVISERLAETMSATTYAGTDRATGAPIVVKHLALRGLRDWKLLELLQREAEALAALEHAAIPRYIDAFSEGGDADPSFFLVQQRAPGVSLAQRLATGWRPSQSELHGIAQQVLHALAYLHARRPPMIHRDVKPANLIAAPDGKVYLVDFGAVTNLQRDALGTSHTLVGTFGYMAPEQLSGHVVPASDLYALGHTLVHLATGTSPQELPRARGALVFRGHAPLSPMFARFLDRMIASHVEDRFASADAALAALRGEAAPSPRRWRRAAVVAATALTVLGAGAFGLHLARRAAASEPFLIGRQPHFEPPTSAYVVTDPGGGYGTFGFDTLPVFQQAAALVADPDPASWRRVLGYAAAMCVAAPAPAHTPLLRTFAGLAITSGQTSGPSYVSAVGPGKYGAGPAIVIAGASWLRAARDGVALATTQRGVAIDSHYAMPSLRDALVISTGDVTIANDDIAGTVILAAGTVRVPRGSIEDSIVIAGKAVELVGSARDSLLAAPRVYADGLEGSTVMSDARFAELLQRFLAIVEPVRLAPVSRSTRRRGG